MGDCPGGRGVKGDNLFKNLPRNRGTKWTHRTSHPFRKGHHFNKRVQGTGPRIRKENRKEKGSWKWEKGDFQGLGGGRNNESLHSGQCMAGGRAK